MDLLETASQLNLRSGTRKMHAFLEMASVQIAQSSLCWIAGKGPL
jgi:hypothetical protein